MTQALVLLFRKGVDGKGIFWQCVSRVTHSAFSGKKKEPKPKFFGPDILRWGRGLPREGVGGQKVRYVPRSQGNLKLFVRDIPGFCRDIPEVPEKFENKKFVFNSRPLPLVDGDLGCCRPSAERLQKCKSVLHWCFRKGSIKNDGCMCTIGEQTQKVGIGGDEDPKRAP